jgi:hypothetical protein|tara:strand:- start:1295 stop:1498 length:204 start_codon:yes stop_codon:yes gene_type:complete
MRLDQLYKILKDEFPLGHIAQDTDGEIKIYTGLMYKAPPGYSGGPQNVPPDHRVNVRLREMTHEDIT